MCFVDCILPTMHVGISNKSFDTLRPPGGIMKKLVYIAIW